MSEHRDTSENVALCQLIQEMLKISFPGKYKELLASGNAEYAGLSLSWELDSVVGATEFLRGARPDLAPAYVVLRFERDQSVCLDLTAPPSTDDAPVVTIDLDSAFPPIFRNASLADFLIKDRPTPPARGAVTDEWFQKGLAKLDEHMRKLSFEYKHDKGGQIPRSHLWRPYRFCVQDIILGITVIRHNRTLNCLDVDVFLTASIPEYESDSGCRALTLILLADAYKSGGSMEIRFSKHVEGGRIPQELVEMANRHGVPLPAIDRGYIPPSESKRLFLALSGFSHDVAGRIVALERAGRLSSASVSYAMHHGIWTTEEIEIILSLSHTPETILANGPGPEVWHLFQHDLLIGRTAMFGSYLDRQLLRREHQPMTEETAGTVVELEDDERLISIGFDPEYCVKEYRIDPSEPDIPLPWQEGSANAFLNSGATLRVLLRAREGVELRQFFGRDIEQAKQILSSNPHDTIALMVPADFHRLEPLERQKFREAAETVLIIVCPEFVNQIDLAVWKRLDTVKVMRK